MQQPDAVDTRRISISPRIYEVLKEMKGKSAAKTGQSSNFNIVIEDLLKQNAQVKQLQQALAESRDYLKHLLELSIASKVTVVQTGTSPGPVTQQGAFQLGNLPSPSTLAAPPPAPRAKSTPSPVSTDPTSLRKAAIGEMQSMFGETSAETLKRIRERQEREAVFLSLGTSYLTQLADITKYLKDRPEKGKDVLPSIESLSESLTSLRKSDLLVPFMEKYAEASPLKQLKDQLPILGENVKLPDPAKASQMSAIFGDIAQAIKVLASEFRKVPAQASPSPRAPPKADITTPSSVLNTPPPTPLASQATDKSPVRRIENMRDSLELLDYLLSIFPSKI